MSFTAYYKNVFAFNIISPFCCITTVSATHWVAFWQLLGENSRSVESFFFFLKTLPISCTQSHRQSNSCVEAQVQRPTTQTAGSSHFLPLDQMLMWPLRKWLFKKPQEWTALPEFWTQKHSYTQNRKSQSNHSKSVLLTDQPDPAVAHGLVISAQCQTSASNPLLRNPLL